MTTPPVFSAKWLIKSPGKLITVIVFLILDFLDNFFCIVFRILDECFEGKAAPCYCEKKGELVGDDELQLSETLYGRKNVFREMGFLGFARIRENSKKRGGVVGGEVVVNRWSDCGCESCVSWMKNGDHQKLHVVVREPSKATIDDCRVKPTENVIFLHGFLCSSSFWTETVFPYISEPKNRNYRLFAVDLLGFGRSPKPRDCSYTLKDHIEMIEKSVIYPFALDSFHLVGHSMGCIIALALAAKHSNSVKSVTLVAPPFFTTKDGGSSIALNKLAEKSLWPPLLFGSSVMTWYEHLGRCVCFLICRNHRTWEKMLKLITGKRDLHFTAMDLTRHTHHSGWHTMHNVICGGATVLDSYLTVLVKAGTKICIIHGDRDQVVPIECTNNIKMKAPHSEVNILKNADHGSVIFGREKEFAQYLEHIW
ncbi:probable lysophospholipase BODYGUARD 4 isoform X2 [Quercus suber]|uniref:Lysophospholipase bodyguard 4 n=1 Tax=Quercus suber TaxID=58331 RepID=A0AAW0KUA9_QUESU|nr:probable lysophospholipase BODYGUARD 4 isoform X2 [Quercus suber]POE57237.1 isoform 2 of probable lysophospholipase bodyguard 4 [Quercus suber]